MVEGEDVEKSVLVGDRVGARYRIQGRGPMVGWMLGHSTVESGVRRASRQVFGSVVKRGETRTPRGRLRHQTKWVSTGAGS